MTVRNGRRAALAAAVALALSAVAPFAAAQDPRSTEAQEIAREWLALADSLNADATHREAGAKFRAAFTLERWRVALKAARGPLGAVEQRAVASTQLTRTLPGQPNAGFARVAFRTSWSTKPHGRELVSLEHEGGRWRVIGYVIQ